MKKILRHGRNSKQSSLGGSDGDDVFTKIKNAFVKAGLVDARCYGNKNNAENYPNEPLGIDIFCEFPDFYWWNHPSGMEYQNLLVEYQFRAGYISDSDFINHLESGSSAVDGNIDASKTRIDVGTDGDSQYIFVTIPIQVTNETGTDVFISLYYDDVEIIYFNGFLGTNIHD